MTPIKGTPVASMQLKMSRSEIQAELLHKLKRRRCWGERYLPVNSLISWIGGRVLRDGKQVREAIDGLIKRGLLQSMKKGSTISLNPAYIKEIETHLKKHGY